MSWLNSLAATTENLLNKVDQAAGHALNKDPLADDALSLQRPPSQNFQEPFNSYSPFLSAQNQRKTSANKAEDAKKPRTLAGSSVGHLSMKSTDHHATNEINSVSISRNTTGAKDVDSEELFEFLNSGKETESTTKKDSRPSSSMSSRSSQSRATPDHHPSGHNSAISVVADGAVKNDGLDINSATDEAPQQQHNPSSLETENQLLKNEIISLNHEMESAIKRIQSTQDELNQMQRKLDRQAAQLSKSEQIVRELQLRESDMQEALTVKDSQFSLLRKRFDESEEELVALKKRITELQAERDNILKDHSLSTDVQGHALDTLQDKLNEAESALRHQQDLYQRTQEETLERQKKLESEKQVLVAEVNSLQRNFNTEKVANTDLSVQLRNARTQTETAKNELAEYKDKAQRILQSKDRLIASLKEGSGSGEMMVHATELDSMRQERDIMREELQNSQMALENLRSELSELENQLQMDSEASREQVTSLEDQLQLEKKRRDDGESEVNRLRQELRYIHEEFVKQKTAFQTRLQDRENEITRLRSQLTTKSTNATSEEELENRLHSLTESLIQKQTTLEALGTEKNSLVLQLERMEKQYREAEASALRATAAAAITIGDDDDVRQRATGGFMNESPLDGNVTRRVKLAANTIDKFSIRLGLFLRRYPIARIFIMVYMGILHLWVMIVLLTYEPEIHTTGNLPHP